MTTPTDHFSLDKQLGAIDLPDTHYKADLELHDRAQDLSSELLKLALGGVAVVGFLLADFPESQLGLGLQDVAVRVLFSASVIAFAASVAAALLQRFYASGALFHHIQTVKFLMLPDASAQPEAEENMSIRTTKFLQAHFFLKCAACALTIGALLLSIAFTRMMFL